MIASGADSPDLQPAGTTTGGVSPVGPVDFMCREPSIRHGTSQACMSSILTLLAEVPLSIISTTLHRRVPQSKGVASLLQPQSRITWPK